MQDLHEALQEAIKTRSTLQILKLLDIEGLDAKREYSPFEIHCVCPLFASGSSVDLVPPDRDSEGNTVLHLILDNEQMTEKMVAKILEIFLDVGIDPSIENNRGVTALHLAVAKRMTDAIDILIKYNAMINACGRSFITHYFVEDENKKFWQITNNDEREVAEVQTATFVDWLISRGFDFHTKDDETEESAFNLAEEKCLLHVLTAVLENTKGLEFDMYIYYRDRKLFDGTLFLDGWRFLLNAPERSWYLDYRLRHATKIVKILLDVTGPMERERSPLLDLALSSNEPSVVELLTSHFPEGCDERSFATNMFYRVMRNLTVWSSSPAKLKIMSDLIARGADVNSRDICRRVPLHWAVMVKNLAVVKFLKANGANFQAVDGAYWNLIHTLADGDAPGLIGFHDIVENLLDSLVSEGVQVNATNKCGRTPLQVAAEDKNCTIARGLIFHGAVVDGITGGGRQFCEKCLQDIRVLKDTFVDGRTSLYRLLHMHPNDRYIYAVNDNLKSIFDSPILGVQFQIYSDRILSAYKEASKRYSLVERAKEAWLEFTEVDLPDECIEHIFMYLSNKDIEAIIKS